MFINHHLGLPSKMRGSFWRVPISHDTTCSQGLQHFRSAHKQAGVPCPTHRWDSVFADVVALCGAGHGFEWKSGTPGCSHTRLVFVGMWMTTHGCWLVLTHSDMKKLHKTMGYSNKLWSFYEPPTNYVYRARSCITDRRRPTLRCSDLVVSTISGRLITSHEYLTLMNQHRDTVEESQRYNLPVGHQWIIFTRY